MTYLDRRQALLGMGAALMATPLTSSGAAAFCEAKLQSTRRHSSQGAANVTTPDEAERQSAANLAVMRRYCAAWRAGDRVALRDLYHDEFTLHYFGQNPLSGDHVGKAAALRALAEVGRRTNRKLLDIIDCMAGPQRATVIAREAFERNGRSAEVDRVLVYTIKDGQLHHCWVYDGDQAVVDRFLADDP